MEELFGVEWRRSQPRPSGLCTPSNIHCCELVTSIALPTFVAVSSCVSVLLSSNSNS